MAILHIQGFPDDLYAHLKKRAIRQGRSISQETVRLIRLGLLAARPKPDAKFEAWFDWVNEQREGWAREGRNFPESARHIREDRDQ